MIQYNLRLDDKVKRRAKKLADQRGLSENRLYQTAIEEYLNHSEAEAFFEKLMNRVVSEKDKRKLMAKLRGHGGPVLFPEDRE